MEVVHWLVGLNVVTSGSSQEGRPGRVERDSLVSITLGSRGRREALGELLRDESVESSYLGKGLMMGEL